MSNLLIENSLDVSSPVVGSEQPHPVLFRSFLQAGFECSSQRRTDGRRLDLLAQTRHDEFALDDFRRVNDLGIFTVRTAARWHLIEAQPGVFHFDSLLPTVRAARATGTEVLLDLLHFGWPDHVDIFRPNFITSFSEYVCATVEWLRSYSDVVTAIAPVNEISFLAWAGGEVAALYPGVIGRGDELKRILVSCALAARKIILAFSSARLIAPEPLIHVVGNPERPSGDDAAAAAFTNAQYQAWDMLSGRLAPDLGGHADCLDILGVNFYPRNQWVNFGPPLSSDDPRFRPFRDMLADVWHRYQKPLFVAETGTEGDGRAAWLSYVCDEVRAARQAGVPVLGICLYPVLNYPGWNDDRHCSCGLWDNADDSGFREPHHPLLAAVRHEQLWMSRLNSAKAPAARQLNRREHTYYAH